MSICRNAFENVGLSLSRTRMFSHLQVKGYMYVST
jgi:hypothetical protein